MSNTKTPLRSARRRLAPTKRALTGRRVGRGAKRKAFKRY